MRVRKRSRLAALLACVIAGAIGMPLPAFAAPDPSTPPESSTAPPTSTPSQTPQVPGETGAPENSDEPVIDDGYVRIDSVSPTLRPDGTLTVEGSIVNGSDSTLEQPELKLEYNRHLLASRKAVREWSNNPQTGLLAAELGSETDSDSSSRTDEAGGKGTGKDTGKHTAKQPAIPESIAPGGSADFTFTVDADDLDFSTISPDRDWGVRGIAVDLSADDGSASGLNTSAPSFTTWYPGPHVKPSKIATLIPISGPHETTEDGLAAGDDLTGAVSQGGRLADLVSNADQDGISWAVDPQLLDSVQHQLADAEDTGEDGTDGDRTAPPTTGPTSSPEENESDRTLRTWYDRFKTEGRARSVLALPWADPSLHALTTSKLSGLLGRAKQQTTTVTSTFPDADTSTAWPVLGTADKPTVKALKQAGYKNVVLGSDQEHDDVAYTPSARGRLKKKGLGAVTADSKLSDLLADLGRNAQDDNTAKKPDDGTATRSPTSKGQYVSRIMAETAAITHERPSISRTVLMAAPRNFAPDGTSLQQLFAGLNQLPWMQTVGLDDVLDAEPDQHPTLTSKSAHTKLNPATLNTLAGPRENFDAFSEILSEPDEAKTELDRELLGLTSARWQQRREQWQDAVSSLVDRLATDVQSVSVVKGSPVLLVTGDNAKVAVQVRNDFSKPAHVVVRMSPETGQLRGGVSKPDKVPAHRRARVDVPVKGLANADVRVHVSVETTAGHQVGKSTVRTVRVRADWEDIGTAIVGGIVALIFIFGIIRTFRRGRVTVSGDELQAAESAANSRLETGEMPIIRTDFRLRRHVRRDDDGPGKGKHE